MSKESIRLSTYDKFVVSLATLAAIVGLFKFGFTAAILKFLFVIIFFKAARALFVWIISDFK